jgi:hypothetical protein
MSTAVTLSTPKASAVPAVIPPSILSDGDLWYHAVFMAAKRGDRKAARCAAHRALAAYRLEQDPQ